MPAPETKHVDSRGRVVLGKAFANRLVIVNQIGEGDLQIIKAEAVPARESWLYKNPDALRAVLGGIEEAREGKLSEGPNLQTGEDLAGAIED
jgi:hypothetical protein